MCGQQITRNEVYLSYHLQMSFFSLFRYVQNICSMFSPIFGFVRASKPITFFFFYLVGAPFLLRCCCLCRHCRPCKIAAAADLPLCCL